MMKVYSNSINLCGDNIFCFSTSNEAELQSIRNILEALIKYNIHTDEVDIFWSYDEVFHFSLEELLEFVNKAKDISKEELKILNKFEVSGLDIYDKIVEILPDLLYANSIFSNSIFDDSITPEVMEYLKPLYLNLYKQEDWEFIEKDFYNYWDNER